VRTKRLIPLNKLRWKRGGHDPSQHCVASLGGGETDWEAGRVVQFDVVNERPRSGSGQTPSTTDPDNSCASHARGTATFSDASFSPLRKSVFTRTNSAMVSSAAGSCMAIAPHQCDLLSKSGRRFASA
jgi:hypothetical protein